MPTNHGFQTSLFERTQYSPRDPRSGLLYQTVQQNFSKFVQAQAAKDGEKQIPEYIEKEFEAYLKCGILEHGFIQLECKKCQVVHRVALSCKRRGFCPSCIGKRMNEGSAFLVEYVFPHVPVRQWVLSFPMPVRFWMAKNPRPPDSSEANSEQKNKKCPPKNRLSWAELLRRTFQVDLTICSLCGGSVRFVKAVMNADEIKIELYRVGQEADP